MKVKDMPTLYVESLRDIYSAEEQLIEALPKVHEAATSPELKKAVKAHLKETQGHRTRLQEVFKMLEEDPKGKTCAAMEGLIEEAGELIESVQDPEVLDAGLIGAAQKVEHYEIASYGTARTFALLLGYDEQAELLDLTLQEEFDCDATLSEIAENSVNAKAAGRGSKGKMTSATK